MERLFSRGRGGAIAAIICALVAAGVFSGALGVDFVFDDLVDIADNPSARAASFLDRSPYTNRPLTKASYALNDAAHGLRPAGYALVNLMLHVVATCCALVLARRAFGRAHTPYADLLAVGATLVWAVHPALTESVTYLSGRSMALSGALTLGALVAASGERPRPFVAFICAALAPLARETALIAPLMALWWRFTIDATAAHDGRRLAPIWLGAGLAALVVALMPRHRDLVAFSLEMRDPLLALRGNVHAAAETLSFWAAPWRVTILPQPPLPYGWMEVETLWRLALFAAAGGAAIALRRRAPVAAFGLGFALLALAPSQSFLWRADPVALKPLYLAGFGLTLAAFGAFSRLVGGRASFMLGLALTAGLAALTVQRNALFARETALFEDATHKTPAQGRAWIAYGAALMGEGRIDEARRAIETGLDLDPSNLTGQALAAQLATIGGVESPH